MGSQQDLLCLPPLPQSSPRTERPSAATACGRNTIPSGDVRGGSPEGPGQAGGGGAGTLASIEHLAGCLRAQGRLEEAEPLCRRALGGSEKKLGPEHPDTSASINNLAVLLMSQGRLEEAEPLYQNDRYY